MRKICQDGSFLRNVGIDTAPARLALEPGEESTSSGKNDAPGRQQPSSQPESGRARPGGQVRLRRPLEGPGGAGLGRGLRVVNALAHTARRGGEGGPCVSVLLFGGGGGGKMAAHGGSAASSALKGLIQQFTAITEKKFVPQFLKSRKYWWNQNHYLVAKECGQMQNKWLMINIQNVQDFACQCLNRDVWSNEAVKNIIREHFIFWQVYHDSEEGQRYIQFYKLGDFPYVSILDPRTGQKLVEWHQLDVSSFLDQVTGFLGEHGQLDGLSSSPPKKCARSESLIDASEDSQLEAAIRASLQETHFDSTQTKQDSRSDEESESELFSGSEEFISVCGSDEEEEVENLAKSRKSPHKDLGHRKEENRRPLTEPPVRTDPGTGTATNHQGLPAVDSEILEMPPEKSDGVVEGIDVNGPKAQLMLRYPDGKREQITLPEQAKLLALVKHVQSKGYPNERFELLTNFPRRKLSHLDYDITLQEAGLCPQETVFVQERN
uniref:UBX domain-containing protein 7 n=1 Tax=Macaca fascicularis TaxID=9541 RepID=A0A2K5W532_MACFA